MGRFGPIDQLDDGGFVPDIQGHGAASDRSGHVACLIGIQVGDDDVTGSGGVGRPGDGGPDARATSGDDDNCIIDLPGATVAAPAALSCSRTGRLPPSAAAAEVVGEALEADLHRSLPELRQFGVLVEELELGFHCGGHVE